MPFHVKFAWMNTDMVSQASHQVTRKDYGNNAIILINGWQTIFDNPWMMLHIPKIYRMCIIWVLCILQLYQNVESLYSPNINAKWLGAMLFETGSYFSLKWQLQKVEACLVMLNRHNFIEAAYTVAGLGDDTSSQNQCMKWSDTDRKKPSQASITSNGARHYCSRLGAAPSAGRAKTTPAFS